MKSWPSPMNVGYFSVSRWNVTAAGRVLGHRCSHAQPRANLRQSWRHYTEAADRMTPGVGNQHSTLTSALEVVLSRNGCETGTC